MCNLFTYEGNDSTFMQTSSERKEERDEYERERNNKEEFFLLK